MHIELNDTLRVFLAENGQAILGLALGLIAAIIHTVLGRRSKKASRKELDEIKAALTNERNWRVDNKDDNARDHSRFQTGLEGLDKNSLKLKDWYEKQEKDIRSLEYRIGQLELEKEQRELPAKKRAYLEQLAAELGVGLVEKKI